MITDITIYTLLSRKIHLTVLVDCSKHTLITITLETGTFVFIIFLLSWRVAVSCMNHTLVFFSFFKLWSTQLCLKTYNINITLWNFYVCYTLDMEMFKSTLGPFYLQYFITPQSVWCWMFIMPVQYVCECKCRWGNSKCIKLQ